MKKIFKNKTFLFTISALLWSLVIFAQDDPGLPIDSDPGAPAAPIDDWVPFMIVVGIVLMSYYVRKMRHLED